MSLHNETRKKSLFKINYGKKKSLPQVPLVIVEQCDRDLNNNTSSSSRNNNNNSSKCHIEKTKHPITTTTTNTTTSTDLYCTYLYDSLKHSKLCPLTRHSLNCLDDVKHDILSNVLYKHKSCTHIKSKTFENEHNIYYQGIVNDAKTHNNITTVCHSSEEQEFSSDIKLPISNSLNDPLLNINLNKTLLQNVCQLSPASIQRAKRMEFIKLSHSPLYNNNSNNAQISSTETNINELKSTHSLPEENKIHYEPIYKRPISSPYSSFTDTDLLTKLHSYDHYYSNKKDNNNNNNNNNELDKLYPKYFLNNDLPNSSSCSSFISLGTISSSPSSSINTSDINLNDKNQSIQLSNIELHNNRKLSNIESKVTTSSQSLHLLLLPRTPLTYNSNNNNKEQLLYQSINNNKSTTINQSRIKSLGDIFKIPYLSLNNELYPKKSCTYSNINKIITDNNNNINDNELQSQCELPHITKGNNNNNNSSSKLYANYLTVPCETTILRKKSQLFNKHIRYSTGYVNNHETIEQTDHYRTQRAVSIDISQTFQQINKYFYQFNNKNDVNRKKSKDYKQSLYDLQLNKSRQVIIQQISVILSIYLFILTHRYWYKKAPI
ncbi:unnamed protein product [Schistosoma margrebowiei]|uniref:Uncharacterized protein n=1 Tax=Schistosoma margrebowiei TaxID=48269 RepID=A0A183MAG3_9TREM|nr:unnamed protein product [Schistosoma margrebowiei]